MATPSIFDVADPNYKTPKQLPENTQEVSIDLPGETIRCVVHKANLDIVLKKHRDVIFDINLGNGKSYTVETTHSDYYNARDKKIVFAKQKTKVTFSDGERMHLWVSRGFKGALLLKSQGNTLMRIEPNEWDKHRPVGSDPKEKAPPIIIALGASAESKQSAMPPATAKPLVMQNPPAKPANQTHTDTTSSAANQVEQQDMHVIEINPKDKDLPLQITDAINKGIDSIVLNFESIKWGWAQVVGVMGYFVDNRQWIDELRKEKMYFQKVVHKNAGTKWYLILKGYAGLRTFFTASKYSVLNTKVLSITNGVGSIKGMAHAAWTGIKDVLKGAAKGGVLAIFLL